MLQACGVTRRSAGRILLEDISLTLRGGDRIAMVGPTGSGKTLLLRCLAMLDPHDAGEILWLGEQIPGPDVPAYRSRVMYLHQRPAIAEGTVEDNLCQSFLLKAHHGKRFKRERIVDLLESLGRTESFLSKQQRDLSGGESQLTALLRAIQLDPNILLLDEPTAALDAATGEMVENMVTSWVNERPAERATVWVSHAPEQAKRVADRTIHMANGRLCIPK